MVRLFHHLYVRVLGGSLANMLMSLISHESRFNGLHFLSQTVYAYLHFAWRDELQKLTEVAKNWKKDTLRVGSRLFNVIKFGTRRNQSFNALARYDHLRIC